MSVLDLRDAYHTLPLAEESQKILWINSLLWITNIHVLKNGNGNVMHPSTMATVCPYNLGTTAKQRAL